MADDVQTVIFRGFSKAELEEIREILDIDQEIINVVDRDDRLAVVEHPPEHTLGEPLTWAAVMLYLKGSKVGERVTAILDKVIKGRPSVKISKSVTIERADGEKQIVDVSVEARGDAVDKLISELRGAAVLFDARPSSTPPTIEHDPHASGAKSSAPPAPPEAPSPEKEPQQKRPRKAPAKEAATEPLKLVAPRKRAGARAEPKGR